MNKLNEHELQSIFENFSECPVVIRAVEEMLSLREQLAALKVDITCYSCRRFITFQQHAEADGFCPYCGVEIELTPSTLAVPNVKTIEDNLIEQVGLMCDQATNIEEKNVYGHAYCVLKYGILPYLRKKGK